MIKKKGLQEDEEMASYFKDLFAKDFFITVLDLRPHRGRGSFLGLNLCVLQFLDILER